MTTTVTGFDGSIDESTFARGQAIANRRGVVASRSSFNASQVANARAVRLTGGTALDAGVLLEVTDATATTQAIPGPQAGQWFLIVIRRDWDKNTVTYAVLSHDATSTATPTAPPVGTPADFADQPGVVADQRLWWVWAVTGSTNVILVDARRMPAALEKSGTAAERAAYYGPLPTTQVARRALQGARWFNTATNLEEVYMAPYDATTNPGGVRAPGTAAAAGAAGWYSVGSNGNVRVITTRYPDSLIMRAGTNSVFDRIDFTLDQGRLLHFRHVMRWYAAGNAAGTAFFSLDGVQLPDMVRIHSEGGPTKTVFVEIEYDLWVPPGTHRLDGIYQSESASTDAYKQDAWTVVTGASD